MMRVDLKASLAVAAPVCLRIDYGHRLGDSRPKISSVWRVQYTMFDSESVRFFCFILPRTIGVEQKSLTTSSLQNNIQPKYLDISALFGCRLPAAVLARSVIVTVSR
jgi:hypothetical protein